MPAYRAVISRVTTGGPFTYVVYRDSLGVKAVTGVATLGSAISGAQADIVAAMGSETPRQISISLTTTNP